MELRNVGRSGLEVTFLGLGCNNFGSRIDEDAAHDVVHACLDEGVTFFDTADIYGAGRSEEFLGRALGARRDEVVVATKFGGPTAEGPNGSGASRAHLVAACEASLRRLGTDYIDLYYQHFPDPSTPAEETLGALDDLVRAGKIRYAASSNLPAWMMVEAEHVARRERTTRFVATQSEWSLLERGIEAEVVPACAAYGIGVVPYYPLASGLLSGKYHRGTPPPAGSRLARPGRYHYENIGTDGAFDTVEALEEVGEKSGRTLLELAIGWLAAQPVVSSVIVGATTPAQVAANVAAAATHLTEDEVAAVSEVTAPR